MGHVKGKNDHLKPSHFPFSSFSQSVCSSIHQKNTFTGILWQLVKGSWTQLPVLLCFHSFFGSVMSPKHQQLDCLWVLLSLPLSLSFNPLTLFQIPSPCLPSYSLIFNIRKNKKGFKSNLVFFSILLHFFSHPPPPLPLSESCWLTAGGGLALQAPPEIPL